MPRADRETIRNDKRRTVRSEPLRSRDSQEWRITVGHLGSRIGPWVDGHCTLRRGQEAVTAGLTLPWSSGVVEGHVNRIKMLKRQRAIGMGIYVTGRPG